MSHSLLMIAIGVTLAIVMQYVFHVEHPGFYWLLGFLTAMIVVGND